MKNFPLLNYFTLLFIILLQLGTFQGQAQSSSPKVVAHRTAWKTQKLPQNSIPGLKRAMELDFYAAEIDIHLTRDNQLIVNHDRTIGMLPIETSSYEELAAGLSAGEKLQKLEDFITTTENSDFTLWLDLKTSKTDMERAVDLGHHVALEVKKLGAADRVVFIGPHFEALVKVLEVLPDASVLYTGTDKDPDSLKDLGFKGVFVSHKKIISGKFDMSPVEQAGLKIGVYTVNKEAVMKTLVEKQVDFIVTDEPEMLLGLLKNREDPISLQEP